MDMSKTSFPLIKKANSLFQQNEFEQAELLYKQAGGQLGMHLVETSIWLCQQRVKSSKVPQQNPITSKYAPSDLYNAENFVKLKTQLNKTQALLEDYYKQTQNLKLQLMQRA